MEDSVGEPGAGRSDGRVVQYAAIWYTSYVARVNKDYK
jgi:hypothetical protein